MGAAQHRPTGAQGVACDPAERKDQRRREDPHGCGAAPADDEGAREEHAKKRTNRAHGSRRAQQQAREGSRVSTTHLEHARGESQRCDLTAGERHVRHDEVAVHDVANVDRHERGCDEPDRSREQPCADEVAARDSRDVEQDPEQDDAVEIVDANLPQCSDQSGIARRSEGLQ
jgi:hypothetical protein